MYLVDNKMRMYNREQNENAYVPGWQLNENAYVPGSQLNENA